MTGCLPKPQCSQSVSQTLDDAAFPLDSSRETALHADWKCAGDRRHTLLTPTATRRALCSIALRTSPRRDLESCRRGVTREGGFCRSQRAYPLRVQSYSLPSRWPGNVFSLARWMLKEGIYRRTTHPLSPMLRFRCDRVKYEETIGDLRNKVSKKTTVPVEKLQVSQERNTRDKHTYLYRAWLAPVPQSSDCLTHTPTQTIPLRGAAPSGLAEPASWELTVCVGCSGDTHAHRCSGTAKSW